MGAGLSVSLGKYQARVDGALEEMKQEKVLERIWAGDHTVWKPDPREITNRLGWLRIAEKGWNGWSVCLRSATPKLPVFISSSE